MKPLQENEIQLCVETNLDDGYERAELKQGF